MKALLKLSGQVLKGAGTDVVDREYLWRLAEVLKRAQGDGHQLAVVIGGGNLYRFVANRRNPRDERLNPTYAHGRGLLAQIFNGLWLADSLAAVGARAKLTSPVFADPNLWVYPYDRADAFEALEHEEITILAGGTGRPGPSSDVAAVQRAIELEIPTILKATHTVDGVYSSDPVRDPTARKLDTLTYQQALDDHLEVMDEAALRQAAEAKLTTIVFSIKDPAVLTRVLAGETIGSTITR